MLKLLLESGELGKGRIGIRLLVATTRTAAEGLSVILFALGALYALTTFTARPVTAGAAVLPIGTFALSFRPLLALVPVLTLLTVGAIARVVTRAARAASRLSGISRCSCRGRFSRRGCSRRAGFECRN